MLQTQITIAKTGEVISSGINKSVAIKNFKHTSCVNDSTELSVGSVCSNAVEVTFFDPERKLILSAGDEIIVTRGDKRIGRFIIETPSRPTSGILKVVGYDYVIKLDKDLTNWVNNFNRFPCPISTFTQAVAEQCGVDFSTDWNDVVNDHYYVRVFSYSGVTGRMLMQWLAQICCRYCYADETGTLRFGWYKPSGVTLTPSGERYYFENALTYADYKTAKIETAQIQPSYSDTVSLWPERDGGLNSYVIRNNAILKDRLSQDTEYCLQNIANFLKDITYTPCKVAIPACLDIQAGSTVNIIDKSGKEITAYVMTKVTSGQKDTLECTGSARRADSQNINTQRPASFSEVANAAQKASQNAVTTGKIQSPDGKTYFDLDSGEIVAQADGYKIVIRDGNVALFDNNGTKRIAIDRYQSPGETSDVFQVMCLTSHGDEAIGIGADETGAWLYAKEYHGSGFVGLRPAWKEGADGTWYLAAE